MFGHAICFPDCIFECAPLPNAQQVFVFDRHTLATPDELRAGVDAALEFLSRSAT